MISKRTIRERVVSYSGFTPGSGGDFARATPTGGWRSVRRGATVTAHTVAMTMSRCAMSATRCMRSGAMRFRFSLAKSHDGKMCTVYIACNKTHHISHCTNVLPNFIQFKLLMSIYLMMARRSDVDDAGGLLALEVCDKTGGQVRGLL